MKSTAILGIVLAIIGVISLAYQGFTYTTQKKAVDLGPIEITKNEKHTIPLPPIIGIVALVGGIALFVTGNKTAS